MYKIKILQKDAKFIVKEEERKVVCLIEGTRFLAEEYIEKNTNLPSIWYDSQVLDLPNRFVGIATCAPDDKWNEELGKKIAFHKAKEKFCVSLFKHLNEFINLYDNYINDAVTKINIYGEKLGRVSDREKEYIEKLIDKNE